MIPNPNLKPPTCIYWVRGKCKHRDLCTFSHVHPDKPLIPPVCRNFNTPVGCRFRDQCCFLHTNDIKLKAQWIWKPTELKKMLRDGETIWQPPTKKPKFSPYWKKPSSKPHIGPTMKPNTGSSHPTVKDEESSVSSEHQCQNCHRMIPKTEAICSTCKQNGVTLPVANNEDKNKCMKCQQVILPNETLCISCTVQPQEHHVVYLNSKPLPVGWRREFDPKTNRYYYYNSVTRVSQWENPMHVRQTNWINPGNRAACA